MLGCNIFKNTLQTVNKCLKQYSVEKGIKKYPRKIFSGIQPTGNIHLGNYLGAIAQWVKLQNDGEDLTLMIADLHSITLPHDPKLLNSNILEITATLMACGINSDKVVLFQQSAVPAHLELNWSLSCVSTMARLAHLPQYKEKSAMLKDVPLGLYIYPVLQAADVLAYKATHVPVGEDQVQHIQLAQELVRMFNRRFGDTFPSPSSIITETVYSRLKSLRDPSKKMSKSDPDPKSRICLNDSSTEIEQKFKKAITDFTSTVTFDPENRPGVSNLISIHSFVTGKDPAVICKEVGNINTGQYKKVVADAVISHIEPLQKEIIRYLNDPQYLINILTIGAEKAEKIANKTMTEVKEKLGLNVRSLVNKRIQLKL